MIGNAFTAAFFVPTQPMSRITNIAVHALWAVFGKTIGHMVIIVGFSLKYRKRCMSNACLKCVTRFKAVGVNSKSTDRRQELTLHNLNMWGKDAAIADLWR